MHDKILAKICKTKLTYRMTPLKPVLLKEKLDQKTSLIQQNPLPLLTKALCSFKMLGSVNPTAQHNIPEDQTP
jgi:hypothetical protein